MENNAIDHVSLGTQLGRGQAFGVIAFKCSAAQAKCLQEIQESGSYKLLGLTWDDFCAQRIGLSGRRVEMIVRNLQEFGETYFHLSEIVNISPETYSKLAPHIEGEIIEFDGEMIPIAPENAARIRAAVHRLRVRLRSTTQALEKHVSPTVASLQTRLDACFNDMHKLRPRLTANHEQNWLAGLVAYSINKLRELEKLVAE